MFSSPSTKPGHGVCVMLSLSLDKLTGEYVILKMSWFIPITPLHRWQLSDFLSFSQNNFAQVVNIRHYSSHVHKSLQIMCDRQGKQALVCKACIWQYYQRIQYQHNGQYTQDEHLLFIIFLSSSPFSCVSTDKIIWWAFRMYCPLVCRYFDTGEVTWKKVLFQT